MKQFSLRFSKWTQFPAIQPGDVLEVADIDDESCILTLDLIHRHEPEAASVSDLGIAVSDGINAADRFGGS